MLAALVAGIGRILVVSLVVRVLGALGIAFVTYQGVQIVTDTLMPAMQQQFGYLPPRLADMFVMLGIDSAMTIIFSAYMAVLTIKLTAGTLSGIAYGQ